MAQSTGDQLTTLCESLKKKKAVLDDKIHADEEVYGGCTKEMRQISAKLEELDDRLTKMKGVRKEYAKTIQEIDFALQKIESSAQQMSERFAKLSKLSVDL